MARGHRRGELSIAVGCVQSGSERFTSETTPIVANGRNNLTALSPELDLYFVAELDQINVYKPQFPTQSLSALLYKWTLPVSAPGLSGYLDRRNPHAVNSILIDRLGLQEVLVCACDDGDVLLYYTQPLATLLHALETDPSHDGLLNPLVVQNVGKSAWGLAVHRNARMLGVSCNTHDIIVFSFALTDDSILYNDPETEWQYPGRSKDTSLALRAHHYNVPNIAFLNSDLDREGRYLVSTDLTGVVILWDLRERNKIRQILPSPSSIHLNPHSGWSVACLDPRWFYIVEDDTDFLGCKSEKDANGTYDLTQARLNVKDSSTIYQAASRLNSATGEENVLERIRRRVAEVRGNMLDLLQAHEAADEDTRLTGPNLDDDILNTDESDDTLSLDADLYEVDEIEEDDADMEDMDLDIDSTLDSMSSLNDGGLSGPLFANSQPFAGFDWASNAVVEHSPSADLSNSDEDSVVDNAETQGPYLSEMQVEPTITTASSISRSANMPLQEVDSQSTSLLKDDDLAECIITKSLVTTSRSEAPFILVHTGADFVSLQSAPFHKLAVLSRDPCHQLTPPAMGWLLQYDRLNLTLVIPELSIIVAATPAGRAAIFTMTRKLAKGRPRSQMKDEYSLRLDHLVPFASQERRGERPHTLLIGIAAAPIQGHGLNGHRWRLLLTYYDHTILSYELWRGNNSTSSFI